MSPGICFFEKQPADCEIDDLRMTLSEIPQWTTLSFLLVLRSPNSAFILISCVPASKPNGLENVLTSKYTIPVFGEFAYALSGLKYPGAPETLKGQFCCHNLP